MVLMKICNRIIEYSFYSLFLLVPLTFTSATSELFELNKMWLTWGLTIIIATFWSIKMVLQKKFFFQRTPLDLPILLFLISQTISTIFSLDSHTSFWGYYSRFNGGLLSILSYVLLYYAFLSNLGYLRYLRRMLLLSLASGLIVALWGLPSHFGYDPTCLLFRGTLDVSCWTADFMPKVRIFSTLGQPNWLAAYLAILIPISIAFAIKNLKSKITNHKQIQNNNNQNSRHFDIWNLFGAWDLKFVIFTGLAVLFYVDLLYTRAQSGFLGIWFALMFFAGFYVFYYGKRSLFLNFKSLILILAVITFIIGVPINQLQKFTLEGIRSNFQKSQVSKTTSAPAQTSKQPVNTGGTESGNIRLNVWTGAISAWKANPIFGTGVETFAFAYYKYKPVGQNLTSEWNFLYNKAHNEYLNYLTTTGILGLGTYLLMIGYFFTTVMLNLFQHLNNSKNEILKRVQDDTNKILIIALIASYVSILITNFFGFSVVITNVYLFMIPAFVFVLTSHSPTHLITQSPNKPITISLYQWTGVFFIVVICYLLLVALFRYWQADVAYALGYNLDRAGEYQQAYPNLRKAVELRGSEPVFKDELSFNNAAIAAGLFSQKPKDSSEEAINVASSLAQEAINISNEVVSQYPNNAVFWKTRTRLFFTLSQVDSRYLPRALDAIEKASLLAPNDANIWYNLGVLYGQTNNLEEGTAALEKTVSLKPDYRDAHFGLGLFYRQKATDENGNVADPALQKKAVEQMQYILDNIFPKDADARQSLETWGK